MKLISLDVETTKLPFFRPWQKEAKLVSVGMVNIKEQFKEWIFHHNEIDISNDTYFDYIEENKSIIKKCDLIIAHNAKFDLQWLRSLGINYDHCDIHCTQVAEYMLTGQKFGKKQLTLDVVSKKYGLPVKDDKIKAFWEDDVDTPDIPLDILSPYLEQDCRNSLEIYKNQIEKLKKHNMQMLFKVQMIMLKVLADMEYEGINFDKDTAYNHVSILKEQIEQQELKLKELFGFDCLLTSNDDLSAALYGGYIKRDSTKWVRQSKKIKIPESFVFTYKDGRKKVKTRKVDFVTSYFREKKYEEQIPVKGVGFQPLPNTGVKGKDGFYKTNKDILNQLRCPTKELREVKRMLLELSVAQKAYETLVGKGDGKKGLVNKIEDGGHIHANFNQAVTKTGRLSSSNPNLQNQPRSDTSPLKECFIPDKGHDYIVDGDLSSLEWRKAAQLSQDSVMINEISNKICPHTANAIDQFGVSLTDKNFDSVRTTAKIMTFRLLYGGSAYGFYMDTKMPNFSLKKWQRIVDAFFKKYQGLQTWQNKNIQLVYKNGGWLKSPTGRIYTFKKNSKGTYEESQIKNFPVQGGAFDVMSVVFGIIAHKYKKYNLASKLKLQVHDSVVSSVIEKELNVVAELFLETFRAIPQYMKKVFNIDWVVPMDGEIKYGPNYGIMKKYKGN